MEFKVKGKITLDDLKAFYKEAGARSVLFRLSLDFIMTILVFEFIVFIANDIVSGKFQNVSITVIIGLYIALIIWRKIYFPNAVKKIYESDKAYALEGEFTFTENQIESKDERSQETIKKEDIYFMVFGSSGIYIYKSRTKAELIPKHFFESEEKWNQFIEFAKQNYVPEPKKMRIYKPLKWWKRMLSVLAAIALSVIYFISIMH